MNRVFLNQLTFNNEVFTMKQNIMCTFCNDIVDVTNQINESDLNEKFKTKLL